MDKDKKNLLEGLIGFTLPLKDIENALRKFKWDSDIELVILKPQHFKYVLENYIKDKISVQQVEAWANLIEVRDDIGFGNSQKEEQIVKELIFELANPLLTVPLTKERAKELIDSIEKF